jgi:hypothetical protein
MIRPLTIATCLLACGSGLYLYQSKHQVSMLDRTIEKTVHETNSLREQSRLLAAEWTMLNDPQRLQQFSDTYLTLKSIAPTQFTSLADLDSRLPAPQPAAPPATAPDAPDGEAPAAVVADAVPTDAADPASDQSGAAVVAEDALPVPPIPAAPAILKASTVAAAVRPDTRTAERTPVSRPADSQARSVAIAEARPFDQRPNDQRRFDPRPSEPHQFEPRQAEQRVAPHVMEARTEVRPAPSYRPIVLAAPRSYPAYAPVNSPARQQYRAPMVAVSTPYGGGGSLLGMAHGSMPPAPRPTPVSASYNSN